MNKHKFIKYYISAIFGFLTVLLCYSTSAAFIDGNMKYHFNQGVTAFNNDDFGFALYSFSLFLGRQSTQPASDQGARRQQEAIQIVNYCLSKLRTAQNVKKQFDRYHPYVRIRAQLAGKYSGPPDIVTEDIVIQQDPQNLNRPISPAPIY